CLLRPKLAGAASSAPTNLVLAGREGPAFAPARHAGTNQVGSHGTNLVPWAFGEESPRQDQTCRGGLC
ncbi:MAG: hypothetical protein ACRD22_20515, partial [Terriglobia bacterium]